MVIFVKENKKGTAVIAVGGLYPPSYVDKKKKLKIKNERREKAKKGKIRSRYSYQLIDCELWIFSVVMIITLWG